MLFKDKYIKRFWCRVDKKDGNDCWEWLAGRNPGGYGIFGIHSGYIPAHRFSLMLHLNRELSSKEYACHRCNNPACVNPKHLYIGSAKTNGQDRSRRIKAEQHRRQSLGPEIAEDSIDKPEDDFVTDEIIRSLSCSHKIACKHECWKTAKEIMWLMHQIQNHGAC